jgi:hypothetical protein
VIKRIRRKSRVPGVFPLWPETLAAIDWFIAQRAKTDFASSDHVMITRRGAVFDRQRISNAWNRLLERVQADHAFFRSLSFKHLRKTAGQLVRNRSDGEISGVFLCHGRAVKSDDLTDVYTNRPFDRVAGALQQVRVDLQPMIDAAPDAFSKRMGATAPNITRMTIDRIQELHARGVRPIGIARLAGVSVQTVYKRINRQVTQPAATPQMKAEPTKAATRSKS